MKVGTAGDTSTFTPIVFTNNSETGTVVPEKK